MKTAAASIRSFANYWENKLKDRNTSQPSAGHVVSAQTMLVSEEELAYFRKLTNRHPVAELVVLLSVYGVLLKKYFDDYNGLIYSADAFEGYESKPMQPSLFMVDHANDLHLKRVMIKVRSEIQDVYDYCIHSAQSPQPDALTYEPEKLTAFGMSFSFRPHKKTAAFQLNIWRDQQDGIQLCIAVREGFIGKSVAGYFLEDFKAWLVNLESYLHLSPADIALFHEMQHGASPIEFWHEGDWTITAEGRLSRKAQQIHNPYILHPSYSQQ